MTVRARKVLESADRLVHFCKRGRRGNARTIADAVVGQNPDREIALVYPVTTEIPAEHPDYAAALNPFYEEAAARLLAEVEAGRTVAVLCEGDPFFYGSFMHLWWRLKDRIPAEVVPGCHRHVGRLDPRRRADHLGRRRAHRGTRNIARGGADATPLRHRRSRGDEARSQPAEGPRGARNAVGLLERAIYVERATMAEEKIVPLSELPEDFDAPYFSLIIVPGQGRRV